MAIENTITGNEESDVFTPSTDNVVVVVDNPGDGDVVLMIKSPNSKWVRLTDMTGGFGMQTPDTAITYKFVAHDCDDNVNVYIGP